MIPIKTSLSSTAEQRLPPDVDNTKSDDQEEEEMVIMKRLPGVTTRLWEGLLRGRGFQMKEGRLIRSPDRKAARLPHCAQWLRAIFPESLLQVLVGIVKEEPDDRFGNFRPLGIKDEHLIVELVHQLNLY